MTRAVSPWTWRLAVRDHGPESAATCIVLYVIGTYMDRGGGAYPSQQLVARGARMSVRTVQRHIAAAVRMGWLFVGSAARGGQGWRHNSYLAVVPDGLELGETDERIADVVDPAVIALPSDRDDIAVSSPTAKRSDTIVSSRSVPEAGRDGNVVMNVTTNAAEGDDNRREGDDTGRQNVTTQLCRTNSRSETPALRTHASSEAHADAPSRVSSADTRGDADSDESPTWLSEWTKIREIYPQSPVGSPAWWDGADEAWAAACRRGVDPAEAVRAILGYARSYAAGLIPDLVSPAERIAAFSPSKRRRSAPLVRQATTSTEMVAAP